MYKVLFKYPTLFPDFADFTCTLKKRFEKGKKITAIMEAYVYSGVFLHIKNIYFCIVF